MHFALSMAAVVLVSSATLLYQFWSGAMSQEDTEPAH